MPGTKDKYYWDTCLFIAWLKDETRKRGDMDGVREFIQRARKQQISIMTSVITFTEITDAKIPTGAMDLFDDLLKHRSLGRVSVDTKIAKLASNLRGYYLQRTGEYEGKTLGTPDAIHLATAILHKATAFHTFDQNNRENTLGLTPLSGNVAGHNLLICTPEANQPGLDLRT